MPYVHEYFERKPSAWDILDFLMNATKKITQGENEHNSYIITISRAQMNFNFV
ncbi:hypothetical protein RhiirA4_402895 [Rhizophagus irregularis]|uniref:Uncharacterized protein n=1 Tax=Rhizophagus irregularis TaxID=588596 RepID=A0A2I1GJS2_9GLOM|nr:hypothetical protein RhiirA4_402895 [Rhizophagus irregularis]